MPDPTRPEAPLDPQKFRWPNWQGPLVWNDEWLTGLAHQLDQWIDGETRNAGPGFSENLQTYAVTMLLKLAKQEHAALATATAERDAALARVAELEERLGEP